MPVVYRFRCRHVILHRSLPLMDAFYPISLFIFFFTSFSLSLSLSLSLSVAVMILRSSSFKSSGVLFCACLSCGFRLFAVPPGLEFLFYYVYGHLFLYFFFASAEKVFMCCDPTCMSWCG